MAVVAGGVGLGAMPTAAAVAKDFHGETLTVIDYGGGWQKSWDQYVIQPFEKMYNAKVVEVQSLTGPTVAKMRAQRDNPQFDVWMMADLGATVVKNDGLVQPLDPNAIPNLAQVRPQARYPGNPYVDFAFFAMTIGYNTQAVKNPPLHWADLFKPEYKGHLVLPDINTCCGFLFVVMESYLNGGSLDNMAPGFQKLRELKPSVLTFSSSWDQIVSMVTTGQTWIALASSDRIGGAGLNGAPLKSIYPSEGSVAFPNAIGIVKGTKHLALAEAYINWVLSPEAQAGHGNHAVVIPANPLAKLLPNILQYLPTEAVLKKSIYPDWEKVGRDTAQWTKEWQNIIAR
jgi:putative spermidine/putrescine transport system substrate-binding protein